ncbi:hypothetical protein IAU59_002574 [Kwoniella sp. CBS 9459]
MSAQLVPSALLNGTRTVHAPHGLRPSPAGVRASVATTVNAATEDQSAAVIDIDPVQSETSRVLTVIVKGTGILEGTEVGSGRRVPLVIEAETAIGIDVIGGGDHKDKGESRRDRDREHDRERESKSHRHSKHRRRSRSRSSSSGSSSSDSESESDSEEERRRRRRKEKERRRDKEDKEERRRRKEKKREKKAKKDRKRKGTAASTAQWGQYGIISELDIISKDSEFRAWLVEERTINPETISKDRTKKEFAVFVEDYNTATLPHEKYYDMAKYDMKMNMIRSGQTLPDESGGYDPFADMKAHSSGLKSQTKQQETLYSREQIEELRRVEAERTQVAKRKQMGLEVPRNLGVRTEEYNPLTH